MTVFHRRVRMVSFRLSDEEYCQALQTCLDQGFRSVSALARAATVRTAKEESHDQQHQDDQATTASLSTAAGSYPDLEARLKELTQILTRVTALLDLNVSVNHGTGADNTPPHQPQAAIAAAAAASSN